PAPPPGFDYDVCDAQTILKLATVKNGRIVLPSGMTYRVLVLPDSQRMTPALAQSVQKLVKDGATVVGPKPTTSPSLSGAPQADDLVRRIGQDIWDDCDGSTVTENTHGKGKIIWGQDLHQVLAGVTKDFEVTEAPQGADFRYIHRRDG